MNNVLGVFPPATVASPDMIFREIRAIHYQWLTQDLDYLQSGKLNFFLSEFGEFIPFGTDSARWLTRSLT